MKSSWYSSGNFTFNVISNNTLATEKYHVHTNTVTRPKKTRTVCKARVVWEIIDNVWLHRNLLQSLSRTVSPYYWRQVQLIHHPYGVILLAFFLKSFSKQRFCAVEEDILCSQRITVNNEDLLFLMVNHGTIPLHVLFHSRRINHKKSLLQNELPYVLNIMMFNMITYLHKINIEIITQMKSEWAKNGGVIQRLANIQLFFTVKERLGLVRARITRRLHPCTSFRSSNRSNIRSTSLPKFIWAAVA